MAPTPEEKRAQLARLLREKARKPRQAPASFSQERMWFLDQWNPGSALFNMPVAVRLTGTLHLEPLERALQELVSRHEPLRTTLSAQEGAPVQLIAPSVEVPLTLVDLQEHPESEREAEAWKHMRAEALRPFELSQGPLLRTVLYRLSAREHLLMLNLHHAIADGWSMGVLVRELATLYPAFLEGKPSPLPALPLQYAEYAAWQRQWLQGEVLESQLGYWRSRLDPNAVLELPGDKPRPAALSSHGVRQHLVLSPELTQSLKALAQREGKTFFATLLAAFEILLHRYTGQTDLTVGTLVAGRERAELEGLIGLFINALALRTSVAGDPTFLELLGRVFETAREAQSHQDVPFEKLVEALKPERSSRHLPLFQVMLNLQNAPLPPLQVPDLVMEVLPVHTETTKHDLTLYATELAEGLRLSAEYSTDLFEAPTMLRMLGHLRSLLTAIVENPEQRISELPMLTAEERRQILEEWNGPKAELPANACLHTLIEAQVERTPEAVALVFEGQSLTYRELDARANQLAWHLRSLGVGPEVRVGLCLERSLEMVIALLATLKAGGAYVPLDPDYPSQRLVWMLEDARPAVLLAQQRLLSRLPPHQARVLCLDSQWDEVAAHPRHAPPPLATPDSLAYVIFTSGSTGRPKGAMNAHGPVCNRLLWMQNEYGLEPQDTVLQKTPFSFDVSVWEFFWPLMVGARLVVAKPGGHQEPAYLVRLIAEARVTTLHFVPSMLQVFLEEPGLERCAALRRVVCSGEALPLELAERCLQRLPQAGLHNLYGPTEAAVDVTYYACVRGEHRRSVPIGRPVANTSIRLLDAKLRPVPIGVPGELFIGGVQVGRGYLSRPELTAERFIPDPFSETPGARMYRTGDVARWLPDGNFEYLGRADFQVKIRGLRIELGEIESTLEQHPTVQQAVVLAREDVPGDKRLVAYVVGRGGSAAVDPEALEARLREKLPEYMVPSALVVLEAMPLNPNGKVDRKALPAPKLERKREEPIAPSTPTEAEVAALFSELLHVEQVGAQDDLFRLGGNSLMATRVVARLRARFGVELPVRVLFQHSTVQAVARLVDEARSGGESKQERKHEAKRRERQPVLPLRAAELPEDASLGAPEKPRLTAEERHRLLVEWNATHSDYPREACAHELVEAHARARPDSLAVADKQRKLTYRELDERANQLAHHLRALGVGPESVGVVCVERSVDFIVGALAILKAGGAYLPVDVAYPVEWQRQVVGDSGAKVVLTRKARAGRVEGAGAAVVCLDEERVLEAQPKHRPETGVCAENLAYSIYTSGSTGRPKGVAVTHRSLVNLGRWYQRTYEVKPEDRATLVVGLSFDVSVWEVWLNLMAGASVHMPEDEVRLEPRRLLQWLAEEKITISFMATPMAEGVLREPWGEGVVLRWLFTGGDKLHRRPRRELKAALVNVYGPAENTVATTICTVEPEGMAEGSPHIGRPLANVRVYVLDERLAPVPVGVWGELYIGGENLGRGYLERPALTAERFLPNPFEEGGARMYRTGDVVRYLPDGNIEFRGRNDFQVKIRGFRIELGEIQSVLDKHPGVRQVVVIAREDVPGNKRLVAYYVAQEGQAPEASELREHVKQKLPAHMVPSAFVRLEALPLTPNGKVDRKALPVPAMERTSLRPYVAPRTPTEELLAGLWRQVLGVERVSAEDHFLELGGHSLLATQVVSRLRSSARIELPLKAFFETPTLEALAREVDATRDAGSALPVIPPLLPMPRTERLALSFAQQRLWVLDRFEPGSTAYTILAALRLQGPLNVRALVLAMQELMRRHEGLRTTFVEDEQGPLQVILPDVEPSIGLVDLQGLPESEREREALALAAEEAERPFDLTRAPLLRSLLVRLSGQHHLLVVTMHHIISDGWSSGILIQELSALYEAFSIGEQPRLAPLPVQYADYAVWQRQWLKGEVLGSQLAYWRKQLAGAPAALELPTDKPRPPVPSFRGGRVPVRLGRELTASLQALCQREGVTLFMALLAGFQTLLSANSGQLDVSVGSPIAGRGQPELEGLLGCFVNTLVLRTRMEGDPSFRELLGRVREVTLGAYAHQDVPFERVVEELLPSRDASRSPLFQVLFVLENAPTSQPMGPGLSMRFVDVERHSAKFDLTLALWEEEQGITGVLEYSSDLFESFTAARMAEHLRALLAWTVEHPEEPMSRLRLALASGDVLVPLRTGGSRRPFFCVHPIGGNVLCYAELVRHLDAEQPFYGLQARGLEGEQAPLESLEEMAALYVEALRTVQPKGPYRLGGWSMGAVVAFEMARLLKQQGEEVEHLVFIEPSPTSYAQGTRLEDEATLNSLFAANLAQTMGLPLELPAHVQPGDSAALLRYLWEEGRAVGAFGPEMGLAQLQKLQRVFTGCVRALYQHTLKPLPLPLTMLRGQEAQVGDPDAPDRGWAALSAHVEMEVVPGDHYSALRSPQVETVARTLARVLESPPRRLQAVAG